MKDENYYPQVFLKECKYIEKKVVGHIIDDFGSSSDDSYDSHEEWIKYNVFRENNFRKFIFFWEQFWIGILDAWAASK